MTPTETKGRVVFRQIKILAVLFIVAAVGLTSTACAAEAEKPILRLIHTVPLQQVKGSFDLMAADAAGQRLFLAAEDNNTLEVIDLAAGRHIHSIAGFDAPKWVVYRPESQRLHVSNGDGSVRVLDANTFAPIKQFSFPGKANNLRYDDTTKELFVGVGNRFGEIGIIDTVRDVITGKIALTSYPKQFELDGNRIYVNVPKAHHVAVLNRTTMKQVAVWPVCETDENVPMGFDPARHRLFAGCETGKLIVLDTASGTAVARLDICAEPDGVYYDATRHLIYISCGAGSIDVVRQIDADHYEMEARIPTPPGAATSLFIPELNRFCLAVPQKENQAAELRIYAVSAEQPAIEN
jgi:DNA-binding beta-propeller fold protein YncE